MESQSLAISQPTLREGVASLSALLDVDQVARWLNISESKVRALARDGEENKGMKAIKIGTDWRFERQWVEDYIQRAIYNA